MNDKSDHDEGLGDRWRLETCAVHAGYSPRLNQRAVALPIYQTAAFSFDDTQHAEDIFEGKVNDYVYTRLGNPTTSVLEQRLATLEGGIGGLALASGQAALTCAIQTIAGLGDNVVAASSLYGTSYNLLANVLPQYGVRAKFCDNNDFDAFERAIDRDTRALFCETIANPAGHVADIAQLASIARRAGVPLIVDNTIPTPYLCRPIEFGADIVIHSLTKYLGGHGNALGGAVIDSGNFPWEEFKSKFPRLCLPDDSHHGITFTKEYGRRAFLARCSLGPLRNMGAVLSPYNAFLLVQGIETLALRMDRICFNAELIARYLQGHALVESVAYAGLADHPERARVERFCGGRASGVLSFVLRGDGGAGRRFQDALKLITRSVNIGDCKTLTCHPASTTHKQLSVEGRLRSGVTDQLVRFSIGIEHVEDLLEDIEQALQCMNEHRVGAQ